MKKVFIFWDNSNIFVSAKTVAAAKEGADATYRIRIQFDHLLQLAAAGRKVEFAIAVGSVPPELRHVWNKLESTGVVVELFERGAQSEKEQAVDQALQVHMLRKTIDYNGHAGTVVMLTGDGKGFLDGVGFHADLERMHKKGWEVEVLAWEQTCNPRLKFWAKDIGIFVPLEDFYESVTFTDDEKGVIRKSKLLDLSKRPMSKA
ncbi:MAG: NYN domain-containing protein [Candidatus Omnitrophica bacterium]|nr:NYN domain-containing protein [Candidatus Omnitrophota bacterium]